MITPERQEDLVIMAGVALTLLMGMALAIGVLLVWQ